MSILPVSAQQGNTTTYVYDANGRLSAVIGPTGEAAVYEYDAAGNITAIRRLAASTLAILSFSPHEGLPGDQVTFVGVGFGGGVTNVSFNGASAAIVSVTPSRVVATVPPAATTGLVTITTPTGSASTATPFTIAGLRITPSFVALKFGETAQFSAEVLPLTFDQEVRWSVENIIGGNVNVGTISAAGLYTAPNTRFTSLTITATSVADNSRFAEAHVRVSDPNDVQSVFATSVSVRRGENVSVVALSLPLAVQHGDLSNSGTALSAGVSVRFGATTQSTALTNPVSVMHDNAALPYSPLDAVAATRGPYIQSLTPVDIARGATVTLTINGIGLSGATALRFITASGATDTSISVSNILVNGDGSSLTATVAVSAGSAVGGRTVFISTPNGDSITVNLGINIINVQ